VGRKWENGILSQSWISDLFASVAKAARSSITKRRSATRPRSIRLERLEERRLLAITVNTLVDEFDGSIVDGDISLRDAIASAAVNETIDFSVAGTIQLSGLGEIPIFQGLTIQGPGADLLTIRAYDSDPNFEGDGSRIFNVDDGIAENLITVSISGLTLEGGDSAAGGGAIRNRENLTVEKSHLKNNTTYGHGGAILTLDGKLTVVDSEISGNTARDYAAYGGGGGIAAFGYLSLLRTAIHGNSADSHGGGVMSQDGDLTIVNSTISGNTAGAIETSLYGDGGGVFIGKKSDPYAGEPYSASIAHSTITANSSFGAGAGVFVQAESDTVVTLSHTIVAKNSEFVDDVAGTVGAKYSLIGQNVGATITDLGGNLIGSDFAPIDPLLSSLADHGGPTLTHALLPGSLAIDAGDPSFNPADPDGDTMTSDAVLFDQRGIPFHRLSDGNGDHITRIDLGAFEVQPPPAFVDGAVVPGEYGTPLAVQDTPTGFGDEDGINQGSELDAAYAAYLPDGSLRLALTGNLQDNGNSIVIFFDTRAGGAVETILGGGYGQLGTFGGQRVDDWGTDTDPDFGVSPTPGGPSILDPGFNPDFAIEFNISNGSRYIYVIDMTVGENSPNQLNQALFLGPVPVDWGAATQDYYRDGGSTFAGQVTHAWNGSNTAGVFGYDFGLPPGELGDPLSATTGLEFLLSADFLNADSGHVIKMLPFITSGSGEYLSNQFLPGLGGITNLGGPGGEGGEPLFDAREFAGDQFIAIPGPPLPGDYNQNGRVDAADYTVWRNTLGGFTDLRANGDNSGASAGVVDEADYAFWKLHFGEVAGSPGSASAIPSTPIELAEALTVESLVTVGASAELGKPDRQLPDRQFVVETLDAESIATAPVRHVPAPLSHRRLASHRHASTQMRELLLESWLNGQAQLTRSTEQAGPTDVLERDCVPEALDEALAGFGEVTDSILPLSRKMLHRA
jgi:hypothetical protein